MDRKIFVNPNAHSLSDWLHVQNDKTNHPNIHVNPSFAHGHSVYFNPKFMEGSATASLPQTAPITQAHSVCEQHHHGPYTWKRERLEKSPRKNIYNAINIPSSSHIYKLDKTKDNSIPTSKSSSISNVFNKQNPYKLVKNEALGVNQPSSSGCLNLAKEMNHTTVLQKKSPIKQHKHFFVNKSFNTKFSLDRRSNAQGKMTKTAKWKRIVSSNTLKIQNLFPKALVTPNKFKLNNHFIPKTVKSNNACNLSKKMEYSNKKIIKIGGIFYKATSKTLTRSVKRTPPKTTHKTQFINNKKKCKRFNGKKLHNKYVINVRGESFVLGKNGKTLRRLLGNSVAARPMYRVHFGGVTFRQTSDNVLVRTESHRVRARLTQAKQKSIACLSAKLRKNNIPCIVYQKLGRCHRLERGSCSYTHDPKNVALCRRFLTGSCTDSDCLLSHNVIHQKVATCHFFLEGTCDRENCPYLHVKVSAKANVCTDFLKGYCEMGEECPKKHVNVCPVFDKLGSCKKGDKCPYPHVKPGKKKVPTGKKSKWRKPDCKDQKITERKEEKKRRKRSCGGQSSQSNIDDKGARYYATDKQMSNDEIVEVVPKRRRLNTLPSYIAFDTVEPEES